MVNASPSFYNPRPFYDTGGVLNSHINHKMKIPQKSPLQRGFLFLGYFEQKDN